MKSELKSQQLIERSLGYIPVKRLKKVEFKIAELQSEYDYFLSMLEDNDEIVNHENDWYQALIDTEQECEDRRSDGEIKYYRFLKVVRKRLIELGVYIPLHKAGIQGRTFSRNGKSYDFKLDGIKYIFYRHLI